MPQSRQTASSVAMVDSLESRKMFVAADPTFASGGVLTRFIAHNDEVAEHAVALNYGVLVQGRSYDDGISLLQPGRTVFALYTPEGKLATKFHGNGKLILSDDLNEKIGIVHDLLRQSNDNVLVVGDHGMALLQANGQFDETFGNNGIASVPQYADDEFDDSWDAVILPNGDIKHVSYSPSTGVLAVAGYDHYGTQISAARRTIPADGGPVYVTSLAETVAFPNGKIRQYRTSLQIESNFGVGGVYDLTNDFKTWANQHKPWTDSNKNPISGIPTSFKLKDSYHLQPSRRGFVVYGVVDGTTGGLPFHEDHFEYSTSLSIDIANDGKSARFYGEDAPAVIYGRTYFSQSASGSFNFQHFGGTFFKTSGVSTKYEDAKFQNINDEYAVDAVPAPDGKFYVFGTVNQYGQGTDDLYRFVVVRTNVV